MAFNQVIKTGIITWDMKDDFEFIDLARLAIHLKVKEWKKPIFDEKYNGPLKIVTKNNTCKLIIFPDTFNDIFLVMYLMIKAKPNTTIRIQSLSHSIILAPDFIDIVTDLIVGYRLYDTKLFEVIIYSYATVFIKDHMIKKQADEKCIRILDRETEFAYEQQDLETLQANYDSWWDIYYQPTAKK